MTGCQHQGGDGKCTWNEKGRCVNRRWSGLPADNLDRVVAILENETKSTGLHGRLVSLGWVSPAGEPLDWHYWVFSQGDAIRANLN